MTPVSPQPLRHIGLAVCLLLTAACRLPADPENTSDLVEGRTLRVGVLSTPLDADDQRALERIAARFNAEPELIATDPHRLFAMLEVGDVHLILGRLPKSTPFAPDIALSDPFGKLRLNDKEVERVLALRQGENHFLVEVNRALKEGGK